MAAKKARDEAAQDFLSKSSEDLESAKLLYDHKQFANSLYHLQQSGEKLAKAQWLLIGILTPNKAREDRTLKYVLGFQPKEPKDYGHRIVPHLVSDLDNMLPSMQELIEFIENSELGPRVAEFLVAFHRSRKSVKKLKKKPFSPVGSAEQLEKEVKAANAVLDSLDQTMEKMKEDLDKLDMTEIVQAAKGLVWKLGFKLDATQPLPELPSLDGLKSGIVRMFRASVLAVLSSAMASLLDPLESNTRYPGSQRSIFDENHPYIKNFMRLHDVIARILQKSLPEGVKGDLKPKSEE